MHCLKCSVPVLAAVLACSPSAHSQLPQAHPSRPLTTVAAVVERLSQKAPSGCGHRSTLSIPSGGCCLFVIPADPASFSFLRRLRCRR